MQLSLKNDNILSMQENNKYSYLSLQDTPGQTAEELKNRIKSRRKEWHYSQAELAARSGVSFGSIKRFERFNEISLTSLLKIAMVLDCLSDFAILFAQPHYETIKDVIDDQKRR
jgi:DNA-binding XRE family transcriptional regulator